MGAEPGGAHLRPKAPLWVDRWLGGRCVVLLFQNSADLYWLTYSENLQKIRSRASSVVRFSEMTPIYFEVFPPPG